MADTIPISITVCGDGGCGKSSITLQLVQRTLVTEYDPTIEDSYSCTREVDGQTYSLSIIDTAGQEEYRSLWSASNLNSDAFLLVYDVTNPSTLFELEAFHRLIEQERQTRLERRRGAEPVCIVAGNKCDLAGQRQVGAKDGSDWATEKGYGFMETSAWQNVNIEKTFAALVRKVVKARKLQAQGYRPILPSATAMTEPLDPPGDDEKPYQIERQRPSRWRWLQNLRCW